MFWERTVASLPLPLVEALRAAGLDDPGTLVEYPRRTVEELERALGITLGGGFVLASSGAASSEKSTATYGHSLPLQVPEWSSLAGSVSVGGVPKTSHASFTSETGGDPKTDHASLTTDTGSDPKNAHSLGFGGISPQSGRLATQTATPDSPACTDSAVSRAECPELADGFTMTNFPAVRDGFPSISEGCESPDEWPRSGVIGQLEAESMNSLSNNTDTVFSQVFHDDEKSEGVRQSDFRVQNLPASGSPSELSAHQMGASLAGTTRLKTELIDPERLDPTILGMQTT